MQIKHLLAASALALATSFASAQTPTPDAPPPMDHAPGVLDHAPDFKGPPPSTLERAHPHEHGGMDHRHFPDPEVHALLKQADAQWDKLEADKAKASAGALSADKDALIDTLGQLREKRKEFMRTHAHEFPHPHGSGFHGPEDAPPAN